MSYIESSIRGGLFLVDKFLPGILTVCGGACSVGATVWACKKTMNVNDILKENDEELENIENANVDEETKIKMKRKLVRKTAGKFVKNYAGPAALEVVAIAASGKAVMTEHERFEGAAAVAATAIQGLKEYRDRVRDRYGDEVEKEIFYNMKKGEVEETVTDEKGKEKKVKKKVNVVDPDATTDFRRYLTRQNQKIWHGGDRLYVEHSINMANEVLTNKLQSGPSGFSALTINEVFDYLGFDPVPEGMTHGWLFDYNNPNLQNKVEITFEECYIPGERGTLEKAYALDFNIDGNIYAMTAGKKDSK